MDLLWKKESNTGLYVNLFEDVPISVQNHFDKLKYKFKANQEFHFLAKNNEKSLEYRRLGNDWFKKKDWKKAITWYNKSLCFAENGTENISLAYANRSSCFLHLEMYAKCLVDIELAIQANYPAHLMPKLLKRQKDCNESMKSGADDKSLNHYPSLDYEANADFPGMANVLEIKRNSEFGRFIEAQQDIPAGKTVLIEKAFSSKSFNYDYCHTCLKTTMNCVPCKNCSWGIFCHNGCLKEDKMHKMECGESLIGMLQLEQTESDMVNKFVNIGLGRVDAKEFFETLEFSMHSILESISLFSNIQKLIDFVEDATQPMKNNIPIRVDDAKSNYRSLLQLSVVPTSTNKVILFHQQAYIAFNYFLLRKDIQNQFSTEQKKRFLMHLLFHQNCVIFSNAFLTHGKQNAFVLCSYFSHACATNMRCINKANMRYGITSRPIKAGQQLFISYISDEFDTSVEETQRLVYRNFGFRCSNCERCKPNEALSCKNAKLMRNDHDFQFFFFQLSDENEKQKILKDVAIGLLNRFGSGHWCDELADVMKCFDHFIFA